MRIIFGEFCITFYLRIENTALLPCEVCNTTLIYYLDEYQCPKCNGIQVLQKDGAIKYAEKLEKLTRKRFLDYLRDFDKYELIYELTQKREDYVTSILFSNQYEAIKLGIIFNSTFIISEVIKFGKERKDKSRLKINEQNIQEVLQTGGYVIDMETALAKVKAGRANVILLKQCDLSILSLRNSKEYVRIYDNETYAWITDLYRSNSIFSEAEAERIISQEGEKFSEPTYRKFTSSEFISSCYEIIAAEYGPLVRSRFYSEIFDIRNFQQVLTDPTELMRLVWKFPKVRGTQTIVTLDKFLSEAQNLLHLNRHKIKKNLVTNKDNDIFPLFIEMKAIPHNNVIISHRFAYVVYTILHAIITKDLFNRETERLSLKFETQDVKLEFEKQGFTYKHDLLERKLQIDGIAVKDTICYVVECKSYSFSTLIEEEIRELQKTRDLKGIIDGKKYTTKNNVTVEEDIVSLPEKVKFVENNKLSLGLSKVKSVVGIIVVRDYTPISIYKDIKIISIREICNLPK